MAHSSGFRPTRSQSFGSGDEVSEPSCGRCPVCDQSQSRFLAEIDGYNYFRCEACESLHIDTETLAAIDAGESTRVYDEAYWAEELRAARQRAAGESLVRAGEAILYARRPIKRFLDVGTGPGYLLDQLADHFPAQADVFHGVELFPPEEHSRHPNYRVGSVGDLDGVFDVGVCIEVVEHLTPRMLSNLAGELAGISAPGSLWFFNTGMPDLVLNHDPGYLDPLNRGHIVSYGLKGVEYLFAPHGFRISALPGKNYAWVAEFAVDGGWVPFADRIWAPLSENKTMLEASGLVYQAAFASARAGLFEEQMVQRSTWALSLDAELEKARNRYAELQGISGDALKKRVDPPLHDPVGLMAELETLNSMLREVWADRELILHSRTWRWSRPLRVVLGWLRHRGG